MPRFSPDGSRIAFTGQRATEQKGQPGFHLYLIPANGGAPALVNTGTTSGNQVAPTWSPDGTRLLYRRDLPSNGESVLGNNSLAIFNLLTGIETAVPGSQHRFNQRWSPDGQSIAATPNDESELDVYSLAAGQWRTVAHRVADYPAWSSDSQYLYFVSRDEHISYLCPRAFNRAKLKHSAASIKPIASPTTSGVNGQAWPRMALRSFWPTLKFSASMPWTSISTESDDSSSHSGREPGAPRGNNGFGHSARPSRGSLRVPLRVRQRRRIGVNRYPSNAE